ncbi:hypothetical protein LZ31DRAFT_63830 [Colletotrichum somersetense]|nr:hypothetical protein LZ31DRAFT_63830 [Colletotrichum somersetense]
MVAICSIARHVAAVLSVVPLFSVCVLPSCHSGAAPPARERCGMSATHGRVGAPAPTGKQCTWDEIKEEGTTQEPYATKELPSKGGPAVTTSPCRLSRAILQPSVAVGGAK